MKWNGTDWINYYCMEVTYTDTEAHIDYSLWNKNKKAFVPTQKDEIYDISCIRQYMND